MSVEDDDQIMYFEFEIKQIPHGLDSSPRSPKGGSTFLNIVDITSLIKNHQRSCDMAYQDAIENNFSHEQMTPLNPILSGMQQHK